MKLVTPAPAELSIDGKGQDLHKVGTVCNFPPTVTRYV